MDCGFGVQIHADFMLDMSRKNIEVTQNPQQSTGTPGRSAAGTGLAHIASVAAAVDVMGFLAWQGHNPAVDDQARLGTRTSCRSAGHGRSRNFDGLFDGYFPVTQPAWPEVITQTLNFFAAGVPASMVNTEDAQCTHCTVHQSFREQQTRILPERVESGVVKVALPLPLVDAGIACAAGVAYFGDVLNRPDA